MNCEIVKGNSKYCFMARLLVIISSLSQARTDKLHTVLEI